MKRLGWIVALLGLGLPAAFGLTFATWRFWRWFEEASGIESFGHSGPAGWCFWLIYVLCVVAGGLALARWRRRRDAGPNPGP